MKRYQRSKQMDIYDYMATRWAIKAENRRPNK